MNRAEHWNTVYTTKTPDDVSWHQVRPEVSLGLIERSGINKDAGIIDVGGGASTLVDHLLEAGYSRLAVLDISHAALAHSRTRLGAQAQHVEWLVADVTEFVPPCSFALWHDRAVFHFLTDAADRRKYVEALRRTVPPGGQVIIAAFALHGPVKCSGLEVCRHDATSVCTELGAEFELLEQAEETHHTPWETEQAFGYYRFRRISA
ncbi:MAG: class I SAM-dependent methyltransferase [Prosthecobacter sp.]|nr:class I SAM-dependent methyltransferase [Prosthecobacter sp.]